MSPLRLERRVPEEDRYRFYRLMLAPTLFGGWSLVREWGRIGQPGQRRIELYESQTRAVEALETWLQRKRRRGYLLRSG